MSQLWLRYTNLMHLAPNIFKNGNMHEFTFYFADFLEIHFIMATSLDGKRQPINHMNESYSSTQTSTSSLL